MHETSPFASPLVTDKSRSSREVMAPVEVSEQMVQKLRGKNEFTVLVTLKQDHLNSGVILSIHHSEHRFLELESSGQRSEVRLHYRTKGQQAHTEVFPYSLADDQWHKVSVAVSASHVILHVDCNRIYERVVEAPFMDIPEDASFWLGQRNAAHGFFKNNFFRNVREKTSEAIEPLSLCHVSQIHIFGTDGATDLHTRSWDITGACPTCNDFHGLVQKIMELQDILAKTSSKNGTVQCEAISCPPPQCPVGTVPAYVKGACCKECQQENGSNPLKGHSCVPVNQRIRRPFFITDHQDRNMHRVVPSEPCPELNCAESEQIALSDRCCKVCRGHDFCSEGHGCVEHSDCVNLEAGDCCVCKDGFRPLRDDNAYCEDMHVSITKQTTRKLHSESVAVTGEKISILISGVYSFAIARVL
ncbi:Protein kinase C-binding protein NELL2 NEL-like protein 2 [Collichthys lucidus]|uniref:Protein kinase C-binding protein NELL2 NEL-like protein 2 n=1 Tax=Collichthys lucidus TaxID=240159 RepID=A0A4V6ANQ0_COLLU|nr:Protein kinase C-binding protein NELL2 NEL-like protein 2 [Collichthys lucidus]